MMTVGYTPIAIRINFCTWYFRTINMYDAYYLWNIQKMYDKIRGKLKFKSIISIHITLEKNSGIMICTKTQTIRTIIVFVQV